MPTKIRLQAPSAALPVPTENIETYAISAATFAGGDLLIASHGKILARIFSSGEIEGDKHAALAALRNARMESRLRSALIAALHHAILLDELLASQARPAPQPVPDVERHLRDGRTIELRRVTPPRPRFLIYRSAPKAVCEADSLVHAMRYALQAAQAWPDAEMAVVQQHQSVRLTVQPARVQAA